MLLVMLLKYSMVKFYKVVWKVLVGEVDKE